MDSIYVKTASGFEAEISPYAMDDIRLLDDLNSLDSGDYGAVSRVLSRLLGEKQKEALYDFCYDPEKGRTTITRVSAVLMEIFTAPELKK